MFNLYPYKNLNDFNLDYILKTLKELKQTVETFIATETVTFADPILWNIASQYAKNTIVLSNTGDAYLSKQAVPANIQLDNAAYWQEIFNFADYVRTANSNLTFNIEQNTTRATDAYAVDDWLLWNDVLYKVTSAIAVDDLLIVNTNIVHFTVEDFIRAFTTWATNTIQQYKNDIDASELLYRQQLAGDIASTTASLQAQLDLAISGATVDSEVINARLGADGVTYATLGDAIRTQISNLATAESGDRTDIEVINDRFVFSFPLTNIIEGMSFTTQSGYYLPDGTRYTSASYDSMSPLISVTAGKSYKIKAFRGYVVAYDSDGLNGQTLITGADDGGQATDKTFTIPDGLSKIGVSWRNSRPMPTAIYLLPTIPETAGQSFKMPLLELELDDISDFENYADGVEAKLDLIQIDTSTFNPPNIIEGETFTLDVGSIWQINGTRASTSETTQYTSLIELIPVIGDCEYIIMGFRGRVVFFDENGENGVLFNTYATVNFTVTCPTGYAYMGISYNHTRVDTPTVIYRNTVIPADYPNLGVNIPKLTTNGLYKYKGSKIVCFGDSITGNYDAPFDYPTRLSKMLGIDAINVGFGGTQLSSSSDSDVDAFCMYRLAYAAMNNDFTIQDAAVVSSTIDNVVEHLNNLESVDWSEVLAVTIEYGTNDIGHSAVLDNPDDMFDTDTFLGALRYTIKTMQEAYPALQILVFTPMYRYAESWSADCNHRTFTDSNGVTHTFNDYIDGMIAVCKYFGIPVFDTFRNSNINEYTYQYYLKDGTHPEDEVGQAHLASLYENAIKNAF